MSQASPDKKIRILLVDDFEMVKVMLRSNLMDLGYTEIEDADNGAIALDMIRGAQKKGTPYDLIFCDWNMPEVTGIEVLELLRRTPAFSKVPFIMVTAESEHEMVARALAAGATDYIVKPIVPSVLADKVGQIVSEISRAN